MEYRTLENTDFVCIYEAFTQAFSDYQVSVDMTLESFETLPCVARQEYVGPAIDADHIPA